MIDLKPCPFCISDATLYDNYEHLGIIGYKPTFWGVKCSKCACKMEWFDDRQVALDEWNIRKD